MPKTFILTNGSAQTRIDELVLKARKKETAHEVNASLDLGTNYHNEMAVNAHRIRKLGAGIGMATAAVLFAADRLGMPRLRGAAEFVITGSAIIAATADTVHANNTYVANELMHVSRNLNQA